MELVRGGDSQVTHLDDGLHPGLSGRALGHHQDPDGLDGTVLGLAQTRGPTADGGPGGLDRIEGIGLALVAPGLAVGSVDFDDLDTLPSQEPGESNSIGSGALDADLGHLAELLEPGQQCLVAGGIGIERLGADQPTQRVECCGNVCVEVGVDTTRDPGCSFYDGHGHPFLSLSRLRGGTAVLDRSDGRSGLLLQAGPITQPQRRGVPLSMCCWKSSADDARGRLMTTSQAESPSAPEAIEDQQRSGGPYGTLSLFGDGRWRGPAVRFRP